MIIRVPGMAVERKKDAVPGAAARVEGGL